MSFFRRLRGDAPDRSVDNAASGIDTLRITGIEPEDEALILTDASAAGQTLSPGDLVLIHPGARMAEPWRGYCEDGLVMRVRAIDRRRPGRRVSVQLASSDIRSLHYEWFEEADLEPFDGSSKDSGAELRDRLLSRFGSTGKPRPA